MEEKSNKHNDSAGSQKASSSQFDDASVYFNIGNEFYSQGDYNQAIDNYLKAIDIDPDNATIYHNAGIISIELDKYELAFEFLTKAVALDNKNDQSFYFLGTVHEVLGNSIRALECYNTAIVLNPNNASAGLAIDNLSIIISQDKDDASTFYDIGLTALDKGNIEQAQDYFLQTINADPEHAEAHCKLAVIYYNKADFLRSLDFFNKAISLNKSFSDDAIYKALKHKLKTDENSIKLLAGLKDRLNNLSPRNRSLRLLRTSKEWNFDLSTLDKIEPEASKRILACLINDVTPINLISFKDNSKYYDDLESEDQLFKLHKKVFNHLNLLHRKVRSLEAETGIYDLFVGYPFIECKTLEGNYLRAPLILNPCHLEKISTPTSGWVLNTDNEFRPVFNDTLFLALKKFNNIEIPDEFYILEKEQEERDLISWTIDYFKKSNIPLEVDCDLNELIHNLPEYKVDEIPDLPAGKLFIRPYAVLGIFPQSTSNLRPDYELMIDNPESLETVLELLGARPASQDTFDFMSNINIDRSGQKENFAINNTDESQEKILISSRNKNNFVIYGPPGTGKSHIILNVISDAIAKNLRVLVVCQKRAALDVIYNRLDSEGLAGQVALVHDHERDKKFIFSKLQFLISKARSLTCSDINTSDTVNLAEVCKSIDHIVADLNEFSYCLQRTSDHGLSPVDLYARLSMIDNDLRVKLNNKYIETNYTNFKELIKPIISIAPLYEKYKDSGYLLANRKNWSGKTDIFKEQLLQTFENIIKYNESIQGLNNYFKSMDVLIYLDKENPDSLFARRNKLITYFSSRNIKLTDYKVSIDAYKASYENIKSDYFKVKRLLTEKLHCGLTLLELYKHTQISVVKKLISVTGYEDTLDYNSLDNFTVAICQLCDYYRRLENDSFVLKRENRTDWQHLKAENIDTLKVQLHTISSLAEDLEHYFILLEPNQKNFNDFFSLKDFLDSFLELVSSFLKRPEILEWLRDWEKANFPMFDYDRSIKEATGYINNLNDNRWDIFQELDLRSCEALSENIKTYSRFKWAIKYFMPDWWKAKKRINNILKPLNIEINPENLENIESKTALTLDYHHLQQIINVELSFISNYQSYNEGELINLLETINPFFAVYKTFRNSVFDTIYDINKISTDASYCEEVLKDLRNINEFVKLYDKTLNNIYNLETFFNKDFMQSLTSTLINITNFINLINDIIDNLSLFEDIISFDQLYFQLSEAQQYIIKALIKEIPVSTENVNQLWKETIYASFLNSWLRQEQFKHPELNKFSYQELQELGKNYTQEKFEEFLNKSSDILNNLDNIYTSIDKLSFAFNIELINNLKVLLNNYEKLSEILNIIVNCFNDYPDLIDLDDRINNLTSEQKLLFEQVKDKWPPAHKNLSNTWEKALTASVFELWIKNIERENPILKSVSDNTLEKNIEILKEKYKEKLKQNKTSLIQTLEDKLKKLPATDKLRGAKKLKDLEYQVNKKRCLWPLRKIVQEFKDNIIFELLPCWLMSPESVSSIMPYEQGLFDIVIFDEASQCPQEYALPSIVRSKQIIVSGDEKQLPPMNIFQTLVEDDFDNEFVTEAQSLLALTKAVYPTCFLSWHYRSKFEELINFSNHAFYNGLIQIAPNVLTEIKPPAIEWHKVEDGRWLNNCNKKEAQAVVDFISTILTENKNPPTLGIITFNNTQQNLIEDLIEKMELDNPQFRSAMLNIQNLDLDERLFVKNIENVQGDEREVIIFSIGYARNYQGKVLTNFGLLNRAGGENRLNVAISRAKNKVHIFSSVDPEDFDVENARHQGPKLFKKYLEYARAVSESSSNPEKLILKEINPHYEHLLEDKELHFSNQFEKILYDRLTKEGFTVHTKVGCSDYKIDLAILHPDDGSRYVLGLECDSTNYFNASSARSRVITRKEFLEAKGWNIYHIWGRNWWLNPDKEFERILTLIQKHRKETLRF